MHFSAPPRRKHFKFFVFCGPPRSESGPIGSWHRVLRNSYSGTSEHGFCTRWTYTLAIGNGLARAYGPNVVLRCAADWARVAVRLAGRRARATPPAPAYGPNVVLRCGSHRGVTLRNDDKKEADAILKIL